MNGQGETNADSTFASRLLTDAAASGHHNLGLRRGRHFGDDWSPGAAGLYPAAMSRRRLYLDSGLLGVRSGGLLLGPRNVGAASHNRRALDARLLGLARGCLRVACRVLGTAHWLLWRRELRPW